MAEKKSSSRWGLYALIFFILSLLGAYTGYWFYMAGELKTGVQEWIDDQRNAGFKMEHGTLEMSGFPYRFHLDVEAPDITTPQGDWRWQGERLMLVMQPWNWNHVIAFVDGKHTLISPQNAPVVLNATGAQGSFSWNSESLTRVSLVTETLTGQQAGNLFALDGAYLHLFPESDDLMIRAGLTGVTLPQAPHDAEWLGTQAGPVDLPLRISYGMTLLESTGDLRSVLNDLEPSLSTPISVINWGPVQLRLRTKAVSLDALQRPEGTIDLRLEDIEGLKTALDQAGQLDEQTRIILESISGGLTAEDSFLPIVMKDGQVQFLFQKIADLPPLL